MDGERMIEQILQILIGSLFFAFLPGYLLVKIAFDELKDLEKLLFSIIFSITIAMAIGIFFGYDRAQAAATGGFNTLNLWKAEVAITSILACTYLIKIMLQKKGIIR